ncbi:WXG100 family type VII secretion target [Microbispora sp. CA-102843]|uniref:WXG100 family type VII secretion target n=1 Tax=Microbispora sp. CA-102843 TaxID=3239952 RepID=UPI003D930CC5
MAERKMPIRAAIDASEPGVVTLDSLRTALEKTDPELIRAASGEFKSVHDKLKSVVETLDRHLDALDKHWTTGEDAKQVKEQLRRLRGSMAAAMTAIVDTSLPGGQTGPPSPHGVVPALDVYASSLNQFRGENVPKPTKSDVDWYDAAVEAGAVGAAGGAIAGSPFAGVGAIPGAVIGGVGGFIVGGIGGAIGSVFGDGPFFNLFGESKEEKDMKAAEEHLKKLTQATQAANALFPASLDTDVPKFDSTPPAYTPVTGPGTTLPNGTLPTDVRGWQNPSSLGDLGTGSGPNGLGDGGFPGWNGVGDPYGPGTGVPGGGIGSGGTGLDGTGGGLDGNGPGGDLNGGLGGTGAGGSAGTGSGGTGGNGTRLDGTGSDGAGHGTSLSAHTPQPADFGGPTGASGAGSGTGYGGGYGGGYGASAGSGAGSGIGTGGTGVNTAALRAGAGNGVVPMAPHGTGGDGERQERERSTWLLEDEDVFVSDQQTTSPRIDRA